MVVLLLIHGSQYYLAEEAFFVFVVLAADTRDCLAGGFLFVVFALTTASDDGLSTFCFGGRHISQ
ncbi:hypothetical protein [Calothrix sp. UHCC 0171]|uniref:hypothetical protein n=1 Tax=Calothrix sp. UHCC 0171 TaxID=3110245 RepID=UPI002B21FA9F|nr:hypothetical protein [Calothrix sp. UHCC 0171]MEA5572533.1 hypothetical protein [Calothrix sp. UHCC 0171]